MQAAIVVHRESGEAFPALSVNISSSGVFVELEQAIALGPEEILTLDITLPSKMDQPFSTWGLGRVVRRHGKNCAIQLCAGCFSRSGRRDVS